MRWGLHPHRIHKVSSVLELLSTSSSRQPLGSNLGRLWTSIDRGLNRLDNTPKSFHLLDREARFGDDLDVDYTAPNIVDLP